MGYFNDEEDVYRFIGRLFRELAVDPDLAPRLKAGGVDGEIRAMEKTSDHAPTWVEMG